MTDQDFIGIEGLQFPENPQILYQEDFLSEQDGIGKEILNREGDYFSPGIIEGFAVSVSGTPGCVDVEAGKARDPEGRRVTKAATAAFSVPDGQTVKIVVRHLWIDEEYTPGGGLARIRRKHSAEIAYIANAETPGDRELELARVTRSGATVTVDADLRVFTIFENDQINANHVITNQITEKTLDAGVTIEGILFRDGAMLNRVTVTSGTQQMESNTEYLVNHTAQVVFTLPTTARVGEIIKVRDINGFGYRINQNAGQNIIIMAKSTTPGTSGYINSKAAYSCIELECVIADTTWQATNVRDQYIIKGYFMGGFIGSPVTVIEDMNFLFETSSVISATLNTANHGGVGVSGNKKGYHMGGLNAGAVIEDMNFATETSSVVSATLDTAKGDGAGVSSNSKGYYMGGNAAGIATAVIEDMNFATETSSVVSATLDTAKHNGVGVSGKLKGYHMGGKNQAGNNLAVIEDMNFSTETSSAILATLDTAKNDGTGVSGISKGYYMGGIVSSPVAVIEDMNFMTEASSVISATLNTAKGIGVGVSGILKGYYMGGTTGSAVAVIEDMDFVFETSSAILATLDTAKYGGTGVQGYVG